MSRLEDKSNNEILSEIKHLEQEHAALKLSMLKDHDTIEALKVKMKKEFLKMEQAEAKFAEANEIILRRLIKCQ